MPDHAVVFVPASLATPEAFSAAATPCIERVEACGYVFGGVVRTWDDALRMMRSGRADVVVVASRALLPHDRRPRVEAATDPVRAAESASRHVVPPEVMRQQLRRPRRIR
ncbi:hypothetical protein [Micromonospora sp. WMMD710]|uniref:hypothetical protein n=1 Tax=Micromonospora sp. WMMD710 TaxID=3016085 RepID=UPI002417AE11|nr:hypothetical protein [Micromonospora sp. WMMD710]MDG4762364.1 hypothetical protein [Micromonospora sp. WMMD710]MDG4762392.1 hypothetical protein [Micromonospora sp. WMMD710]MDG4762410.1 hypothetical protein [Micromonospora sp. WMMD710]MDG4762456.1 hypothetical protein [Micromonospora sp. WMMD710]MDG4762491.1 hypothetical protein [Micromonospora sp. WMMD710]